MEKVVEMSVENGFRSLDKRIELREWTFKVIEGTGAVCLCLCVVGCFIHFGCMLVCEKWTSNGKGRTEYRESERL